MNENIRYGKSHEPRIKVDLLLSFILNNPIIVGRINKAVPMNQMAKNSLMKGIWRKKRF